MDRKTVLNAFLGICLAASVVVIGLYGFSYALDPMTSSHHLHLAENLNIGVFRGALWIYNRDLPYMGSIVGIAGTNGDGVAAQKPQVSGVDFPGIYYRSIKAPTWAMRTLAVSLVYP